MTLRYSTDAAITPAQFVDVLRRSTLAERRPVDDPAAIAAMLQHGNLLVTAWDGATLVGVARTLTDFLYCGYLSDLAVDEGFQKHGVGRELIRLTQSRLGPNAKLILLAAPKAVAYYPKIGFDQHPSAWLIPANRPLL